MRTKQDINQALSKDKLSFDLNSFFNVDVYFLKAFNKIAIMKESIMNETIIP